MQCKVKPQKIVTEMRLTENKLMYSLINSKMLTFYKLNNHWLINSLTLKQENGIKRWFFPSVLNES